VCEQSTQIVVDGAEWEDPVTKDGCYWSLSTQLTRSGSSSAAPGSLASSLKNQFGHRKARVVINTPTGLLISMMNEMCRRVNVVQACYWCAYMLDETHDILFTRTGRPERFTAFRHQDNIPESFVNKVTSCDLYFRVRARHSLMHE